MSIYLYCKLEILLNDIDREVVGAGVLRQEIMYSSAHSSTILGFSRGNYR